MNGYSYLTLEQRREIERMYAEGERVVDIAARLKRSAAAIYEEGVFLIGGEQVYAADPTAKLKSMTLRRNGVSKTVELPSGEQAGSTVEVRFR